MNIDVSAGQIELKSGANNCSIFIHELRDIGYEGFSISSAHACFIVEWKSEGEYKTTIREIIFLPAKNTLLWLDDLILERERHKLYLVGIIELSSVALDEYEVP